MIVGLDIDVTGQTVVYIVVTLVVTPPIEQLDAVGWHEVMVNEVVVTIVDVVQDVVDDDSVPIEVAIAEISDVGTGLVGTGEAGDTNDWENVTGGRTPVVVIPVSEVVKGWVDASEGRPVAINKLVYGTPVLGTGVGRTLRTDNDSKVITVKL